MQKTLKSDVISRLHQRLQEHPRWGGVASFHVSWNEDWLDTLSTLPEGEAQDLEMEKGIAEILRIDEAIRAGDMNAVSL